MGAELFWIGGGIALAGYFIGNGLKYFQTSQPNAIEAFLNDEEDDHELLKESDVHFLLAFQKKTRKHY